MITVGLDAVRLLRDGSAAFPAMLDAIARAEREVLFEMYWVGADRIGDRFRAALVERARAGVSVRVLFDSIGSLGTPASWWSPLVEAGAEIHEFSPLSPLSRRFRFGELTKRDHRKILVVDCVVGFTGGINIGELWDPPDSPETAWRDDVIEVRGPSARLLRSAFFDVWQRCARAIPTDAICATVAGQVEVLSNRIARRPDRAIRRRYRTLVGHAKTSIDIASAYFLPGRGFLHALRRAARRGVRVRVLVPEHSDVWIVGMAMTSLYGRLLADGVEVFLYRPRVLHSKTAIFDRRLTTIGSHNLDEWSSRFDLECNVFVDSSEFAQSVSESFELDLSVSRRLDLESWRKRALHVRLLAWLAALFRAFL